VELRRMTAARPLLFSLLAAVALAGGAPAPKGGGINDPYEAQNRAVHRFNVGLDKDLLKPSSNVYGKVLPAPLRQGVSNVSSNLSEPSYVLNDLLQGNLAAGVQNLFRFVLNTTAGVGGLFDTATAIGLAPRPNDFGRTRHVWGARQGAYLEVPFLGPSTERDLTGTIVDFAINPLRFALNGNERNAALLAEAAAGAEHHRQLDVDGDHLLADHHGHRLSAGLAAKHAAGAARAAGRHHDPHRAGHLPRRLHLFAAVDHPDARQCL